MIVGMMVIGLALLAACVWLLVRAGAVPRLRMESHLAQIGGYGAEPLRGEVEGDDIAVAEPSRLVARLAAALGGWAVETVPSLPRLESKDLNAAGIYSVSPEVIDGYRLLAGGGLAGLALLYATVLSGGFSLLALAITLACAFLGWDLPALVIRRRGRDRLGRIDRQLPDLIDLLVASVEAGLSVSASMALLAERFEGPLGQELRLALQQQRLGTSTAAAVTALSVRADTPSVRALARTLTRAEAMGGSIGPVLRNLAADGRRRRRQAASERAAKVPIKLLFPLVLLIFPSLFVVLLYPAGYTILHAFSG
jgi:Flp pilus assembly protein TadB